MSPAESDEPDAKKRKITFRRLLLNKCQEEFEQGDAAMAAVAKREQKEREQQEAAEAKKDGSGKDKEVGGTLPL